MKRTLFVGYVWPEPRSSAAGSRTMQLIELFRRQNWAVTFASAAALSEHRADLTAIDVTEQSVVLNCDSFDRYVAELQPDIVVFDRFFTEEQFGWRVERACPTALRVLDTCDLHSLREARRELLKAAQRRHSHISARQSVEPVAADQAALFEVMAESDMARRELAAIYRCDLSLIISEYEVELLQQAFAIPPALLHYTPLMPSAGDPRSAMRSADPGPAGFSKRNHFVTIGNFRHGPNWDAVLWLKHQLWPAIRQQLEDARLDIWGAYPPPKATALHNPAEGFYIRGWAEDAHQALAQARVCLAPLRFGAGMKGKLIDAMVAGTPSVTTPIGSEGMAAKMPWGGSLVNDGGAFVRAAVALYLDQARWHRAQHAGWEILARRFAPEQHGAVLVDRLNDALLYREQHRRRNFTGAMLRHHLHASTRYMSQWIAAKEVSRRNASADADQRADKSVDQA